MKRSQGKRPTKKLRAPKSLSRRRNAQRGMNKFQKYISRVHSWYRP